MAPGTLYGVGVGPGDPELITVKGLRLLQAAPIVAFPAGMAGKPGLAQGMIAPWLGSHQHQLPLNFPFVQDTQVLEAAWRAAAQTVGQYLQQGQDVVFVSEGDISFYSTFTYLAQSLQALYPTCKVEAVPGICSPLAAAALLGKPLTVQGQRLVVLPALYHPLELEQVLSWADVVVLMKVSSVYTQIWEILHRYDLLDYSYVVERATLPNQRIYTNLRQHQDLQLPYFSLLIVQVPADRRSENWPTGNSIPNELF